jgi:hypothetical protein
MKQETGQKPPERYTGTCPFESVMNSAASSIQGKPNQFSKGTGHCDACKGSVTWSAQTDASGAVSTSLDCAK